MFPGYRHTCCGGNVKATTARLRVGEDHDEAALAGKREEARFSSVRLCRPLAVVYCHDNRGRSLEIRRHVNVHAQVCGRGSEIVDLGDRLAAANGHESGEDGEGR